MPFTRAGRPGLLGTVARTAAISGTAQVSANAVNHKAARRGQESAARDAPVRDAPAAAQPPPDQRAPADGKELTDQLSRLADLRGSGLLTDVEFAAAKARLLR